MVREDVSCCRSSCHISFYHSSISVNGVLAAYHKSFPFLHLGHFLQIRVWMRASFLLALKSRSG